MKTRYTKEETTPQEIQSQIGIAKDGNKVSVKQSTGIRETEY